MTTNMTEQHIIEYYQNNKHTFSDEFRLRIHRALSWLDKAESTEDEDIRFITLWIAFNAIYAREFLHNSSSERSEFRRFIQSIDRMDKGSRVYELVWNTYSGSIRLLLDNQYVFQPFWDAHNGQISQQAWQSDFERAKKKIGRALADKDTDTILAGIFDRLYTLRNQMVHGGATHGSQVNREQVKDGNAILSSLLPLMLEIMMTHHDQWDWGKPFYPVMD